MPDKKASGIWGFKLNLGGAESDGFFKEINGLRSQINTATDHYEDEQGKPFEFTIPQAGSTQWESITLVRGIDEGTALEEWHKDTEEKGSAETAKDITVEMLDNEGNTVKTFNVVGAFPDSIDFGGFSASGGGVAYQTITLKHEGFHLA